MDFFPRASADLFPVGMHESTHITRAGNGSQADHKGNNYAIQTRKLSQYISRNVGKSNRIHFLESNFPRDSPYLDISFFMNLRTMSSKNISETHFCARCNKPRSYCRNTKWKQQLALLWITASVLAKVSLKSEGRLRWTLVTRRNVRWGDVGV